MVALESSAPPAWPALKRSMPPTALFPCPLPAMMWTCPPSNRTVLYLLSLEEPPCMITLFCCPVQFTWHVPAMREILPASLSLPVVNILIPPPPRACNVSGALGLPASCPAWPVRSRPLRMETPSSPIMFAELVDTKSKSAEGA